jgi:hypothetical protein
MRAPLPRVHDARSHSAGVQAQTQHVEAGSDQFPGCSLDEHGDARVGVDEVPALVDDDGGTGFVPGQHLTQCPADGLHLRGVE